jgi:hypothetical protein
LATPFISHFFRHFLADTLALRFRHATDFRHIFFGFMIIAITPPRHFHCWLAGY